MARILIVEDESADALLLHAIIEGSGHETYFAHDGEEALKVSRKYDFDVVITDLHMPGTDGLELIDGLLGLYPGAAIIAVSGKGPKLMAQAEAMDVFAVFSKPVDPGELLKAVESVISGSPGLMTSVGGREKGPMKRTFLRSGATYHVSERDEVYSDGPEPMSDWVLHFMDYRGIDVGSVRNRTGLRIAELSDEELCLHLAEAEKRDG